jgi:hypothetical protein
MAVLFAPVVFELSAVRPSAVLVEIEPAPRPTLSGVSLKSRIAVLVALLL